MDNREIPAESRSVEEIVKKYLKEKVLPYPEKEEIEDFFRKISQIKDLESISEETKGGIREIILEWAGKEFPDNILDLLSISRKYLSEDSEGIKFVTDYIEEIAIKTMKKIIEEESCLQRANLLRRLFKRITYPQNLPKKIIRKIGGLMLEISKYVWKAVMKEEFRKIFRVIEKEFLIKILKNAASNEIEDAEYIMKVMDRISKKGCDYERLKGYCYPYTMENIYMAIRENISRLGEEGKELEKKIKDCLERYVRKTIETYFKCSEKKITIDFFERAIFFMKKYIELKENFRIEIDVSLLREKFKELLKKEIDYIKSEKERIKKIIKSMEEMEKTYKEFGVESLKAEWRKMWDWRWIFTKLDDIQEEIKKLAEEDISDRVKVLVKLADVLEMAEKYGFFKQMKSLVSEKLEEEKYRKGVLKRIYQKIRKLLKTIK